MKRACNLAKELGISSVLMQHTITKLGIVCERLNGKTIMLLSPEQQNIIIDTLIFERKITEITLESKMNESEPEQESWASFKERTYGKPL